MNGGFSVIDNDFTFTPTDCVQPVTCEAELGDLLGAPTDQLTGHEAGHSVSLPHVAPPPGTLMEDTLPVTDFLTVGGPGQGTNVCPNQVPAPESQCGRVRLQGLCHVPGNTVDLGDFEGGAINSMDAVTHVRLNLFPDGGISRFRVVGQLA